MSEQDQERIFEIEEDLKFPNPDLAFQISASKKEVESLLDRLEEDLSAATRQDLAEAVGLLNDRTVQLVQELSESIDALKRRVARLEGRAAEPPGPLAPQ